MNCKKNGKWTGSITGILPDGKLNHGLQVTHVSDGGKTRKLTGSNWIDGKKVDDLQDVWRRVGS